jgi:hypothetical protein
MIMSQSRTGVRDLKVAVALGVTIELVLFAKIYQTAGDLYEDVNFWLPVSQSPGAHLAEAVVKLRPAFLDAGASLVLANAIVFVIQVSLYSLAFLGIIYLYRISRASTRQKY